MEYLGESKANYHWLTSSYQSNEMVSAIITCPEIKYRIQVIEINWLILCLLFIYSSITVFRLSYYENTSSDPYWICINVWNKVLHIIRCINSFMISILSFHHCFLDLFHCDDKFDHLIIWSNLIIWYISGLCVDTKENLGGPLTNSIDTFVGIAGPNHGVMSKVK